MILKSNIEIVLQRIANTIILNSGLMQSMGLLDGKMGIALFLHSYSKINKNYVYSDFTENLLVEVSYSISHNTISANFANGLTGIGWGIRHLIKEKYIDADADDVLEEVNASLRCIDHSDVISDINFEYEKWEIALKALDYDKLDGIFNMGLYNMVFKNANIEDTIILQKLETIDIQNHIDSIIKDVYRNQNLYNGLAGAGLTLINYFLK